MPLLKCSRKSELHPLKDPANLNLLKALEVFLKRLWILVACMTMFSTAGFGQERPELELVKLLIGTNEKEISGVHIDPNNRITVVADGPEDTYIYLLIPEGLRFHLKKDLNLKKLKGASEYKASLSSVTEVHATDHRYDLEGMTACGTTHYLINERVRHVLAIEDGKSLKKLPIDFIFAYPDLFKGGGNAGFEGIAADCEGKILYIAKERDPRMIFKVDMNTWKVLEVKDVATSDRAGQRVINFKTGIGLMEIGPDISDLFYQNGYLYLLERNTFEIAKVNPKDFSVVARVSYYRSEKDLYQTGEPFGLSESLAMTASEIWIGIDNNKMPLSAVAQKQYQVQGNFSSFMVFKRPAGF